KRAECSQKARIIQPSATPSRVRRRLRVEYRSDGRLRRRNRRTSKDRRFRWRNGDNKTRAFYSTQVFEVLPLKRNLAQAAVRSRALQSRVSSEGSTSFLPEEMKLQKNFAQSRAGA